MAPGPLCASSGVHLTEIIRVFPRRTYATPTDDMAFVSEPGLLRPAADEVHVSCAFTWDIDRVELLARSWGRFYPKVRVGGPAYGDPGGDFTPGKYLREGYTITSRGCPNACNFCLVPEREGGIREIEPIPPGWNVQDNNLLACSDRHIEQVFTMLATQKRPADFTGGFEAVRVRPRVVERLRSIRVAQVFLAYDDEARWGEVTRAIDLLRGAGLSLRQVRCFVLAGLEHDTLAEAEGRCQQVLERGALPFMMLYQPANGWIAYHRDWRALQRKWTRPAAMLTGISKRALARLDEEESEL